MKSKSAFDADGKPTSISLKPISTSSLNRRRLRSPSIGLISAWLPSRRSTETHCGARRSSAAVGPRAGRAARRRRRDGSGGRACSWRKRLLDGEMRWAPGGLRRRREGWPGGDPSNVVCRSIPLPGEEEQRKREQAGRAGGRRGLHRWRDAITQPEAAGAPTTRTRSRRRDAEVARVPLVDDDPRAAEQSSRRASARRGRDGTVATRTGVVLPGSRRIDLRRPCRSPTGSGRSRACRRRARPARSRRCRWAAAATSSGGSTAGSDRCGSASCTSCTSRSRRSGRRARGRSCGRLARDQRRRACASSG